MITGKRKELLDDLAGLLEKHNAAIVRSANNRGDLFISQQLENGEVHEIKFNEDICKEAIRNSWYALCEPYV